jgi:hypothetical protein
MKLVTDCKEVQPGKARLEIKCPQEMIMLRSCWNKVYTVSQIIRKTEEVDVAIQNMANIDEIITHHNVPAPSMHDIHDEGPADDEEPDEEEEELELDEEGISFIQQTVV